MADIKVELLGVFVKKEKTYSYKPGTDSKKSVASMAISVRQPGNKKDSNGYPMSDLWFCKCFGTTADFVDKYLEDGAAVKFEGLLQKTAATEQYPERTEIIINEVGFLPSSRNKKDNGGGGTSVTFNNKSGMNMGVPKAPAAAAATGTSGDLW